MSPGAAGPPDTGVISIIPQTVATAKIGSVAKDSSSQRSAYTANAIFNTVAGRKRFSRAREKNSAGISLTAASVEASPMVASPAPMSFR